MLPQEIIRTKRDGGRLGATELAEFVRGIMEGRVTEGQVAAFCMAAFFRGLDMDECVALTSAMRDSGTVLRWDDLPGPALDKHSTGGVGDKVSLILGPLLAACGAYVPMISGRGLGHTGGTLDKFDSIPGYTTQPDRDTFRRVVREAGCAIIGQTPDLAPADKIIYGVRDVTATVESIGLITASILSKKLAAGLHGLVMDVKFGSGAFMVDPKDAEELALSIATVATGAGVPTVALLTDMNEVLGHSAGNAVEVQESIDILTTGKGDARLIEITMAQCAEILVLGKLAADLADARRKLDQALASGAAAERFARMVAALGGPADILERSQHYLTLAPVRRDVFPDREGVVARVDTRAVGLAVVALGGGRTRAADPVDHGVGLTHVAGLGDRVGPGARPLATVHARTPEAADQAAAALRAAIAVGDGPVRRGPNILKRVG